MAIRFANLYDTQGQLIEFNDDWPEFHQAAIAQTGIPPGDEGNPPFWPRSPRAPIPRSYTGKMGLLALVWSKSTSCPDENTGSRLIRVFPRCRTANEVNLGAKFLEDLGEADAIRAAKSLSIP